MYEQFGYLTALILSLGGLFILDRRFQLAFFFDRRASFVALLAGIVLFLVWDAVGIMAGIFFIGDSPYLSGIRLAPELPLEELFFLTLLSYNALLAWRTGEKLWPVTSR